MSYKIETAYVRGRWTYEVIDVPSGKVVTSGFGVDKEQAQWCAEGWIKEHRPFVAEHQGASNWSNPDPLVRGITESLATEVSQSHPFSTDGSLICKNGMVMFRRAVKPIPEGE